MCQQCLFNYILTSIKFYYFKNLTNLIRKNYYILLTCVYTHVYLQILCIHLIFSEFFYVVAFHSFLQTNNIPLYCYTTFCSSNYLLMGISYVSIFLEIVYYPEVKIHVQHFWWTSILNIKHSWVYTQSRCGMAGPYGKSIFNI